MKFAQDQWFYFLFLIPLLAWGLVYFYRRRRTIMLKFAQMDLIKEIASRYDGRKRILKSWLILFVFVLSIFALSRPQWGFEWQEVKREGLDILILVDTSKSMLTQDVKPNRLERTKLAVKDLLKKLKGDRIGLIAFAGDAFLSCPLTVDYRGFLLSLNELNTNMVSRGGTNISIALKEALESYQDIPNKYKAVILITDGEELEGNAISLAKRAKEENIKIYTIGIGTREGEIIQVSNNRGEFEFLKDNSGNFVKSRLNETLLKKLAIETNGVYVRASGAEFGLDYIYDKELSKLEKREVESKMDKRYHERFQFPLAAAFLLLFIETCVNTRKRKF